MRDHVLCLLLLSLAAACGPLGADWVEQPADVELETAADATEAVEVTTCQPQCAPENACGDDGCGGSCGGCFDFGGAQAPELCRQDGTCCAQQCAGMECGDDGCGGLCGECGEWGQCIAGSCHYTPGWTVLVYAMGDNDLEGSMLAQFNQLMTVGSNEHLNIVVQMDYVEGTSGRPSGWKGKDYQAVQRLVILHDDWEVIEDLPELDSAAPETLADFIAWGVENYPARRYALILDDHGGGYTGFGSDWTNGSWMPLPNIRKGIADGLAEAGLEKVDLLFFYACLMGNFEVAAALQPLARYMLASEELAIGASFRLDRLQLAHDDPETGAEELGYALMEEYVPTWQNAYPDVTVSLVDLEALPVFEAALKQFLDLVVGDLGENMEAIALARNAAEKFAHLPFGFSSMHLVDLGGFLQGLVTERPGLSGAAQATLEAYEAMVVANFAGPGHAGATGLSAFFPPSLKYYSEPNPYSGTSPGDEYEAAGPPAVWQDFIMVALACLKLEYMGPMFACFDGDDNPLCEESDTWLVEGIEDFSLSRPVLLETLADDVQAWFLFGTFPAGGMSQIDFYSRLPAAIDPDTGMVSGLFDYRRLRISQGEKESYAAWHQVAEETESELTIPFIYLSPDSDSLADVEWRGTVKNDTLEVLSSALFIELPDGEYEALEPSPDSKLYPAVERLDMQWHLFGTEPLFTAFDAGLPLALEFVPVDSCESYLYGLLVEDAVGRSDMIMANVCKAEGEPQLTISVKVEGVGDWDEGSPPDFRAELMLDGEPVTWEAVADSEEATFETVTKYRRWMPASLKVTEVDGEDSPAFFETDITKYLYQADGYCSRHKVFNWGGEENPTAAKITLHIVKCN